MNIHGIYAIWKKRSGDSEEEHFAKVSDYFFGYYLLTDDADDADDAKILYQVAAIRAGKKPIET